MSDWNPDEDFVKFLEHLEKKEGKTIALNGKSVLDMIKAGTETGRHIYRQLYKDHDVQKLYKKWQKRNKKRRRR